MNVFYKKNKSNIIPIVIIIIFIILVFLKKITFADGFSESQQMIFITVNSVIMGFLFSGLSFLVSNSDRPRIVRLEKNGYMDAYYNGIYIAMIFNIVSIGISVLFMTTLIKSKLLIYVEQIALYGSLIFFIKSLIVLIFFSRKVREE